MNSHNLCISGLWSFGGLAQFGLDANSGPASDVNLTQKVAAGVTMKSVTLGNVTMSHRTRGPPNALRLSSTMIGLPRKNSA
ncbi:hypothetical protein EVAR_49800_1 [Eumeta japonica]|uniref:Uncharacterized protein n=1 Tax=Eumeta variegata TaxID=151549 RepID=A0A4C1YR19_EUMVA|nr:hypothetical protein EVAR_49800_1 [Eumeta japonica]